MGKSTPSAPAAPDPVKTANAQAAANKETAIAQADLNRINQINPYGTVTYSKSGQVGESGVPLYTQTTTFSPEQQALYDINTQLNKQMGTTAQEQLGRLQTSLAQPISYEGAPALMSGLDEATRSAAEQALMARLNPQLERDRAALESRLASQGIAMGSEAYNEAMDQANRAATDARTQAILQGINSGLSSAQMQNAARQQYIQEAASIRNQPLNEISALMSGTQVQSPTFSSVPQVGVGQTPMAESIYNTYGAQMQNYQNKLNSQNSALGGLFGLGGAVLGGMAGNPALGKFF